MRPDQVWLAAMGELQLQMTRASYDTWLRGASFIAHEDGAYIIGVRSAYAKDWLDERMLATVKRTMAGIAGNAADVRFVVWADELTESDSTPALKASRPRAESATGAVNAGGLSHRYRFDTFVVGPNNRLAHAAALAAAENPAGSYNPLFIYGGVGFGKTHLLSAVGNACVQSGLRVLSVTSEEFTNDLVRAIRLHATESLRNKYRTVDVLLVDDVHFVSGKESTQEEMLHTFNALYNQNKQLVLASCHPPRDLPAIDERLRSRFEWGLTAELLRPNKEMRVSILRAKSRLLSRDVPVQVLTTIAERVDGSVRDLEGALNQVVARAELLGHPLDARSAALALAEQRPMPSHLTPEQVVTTVARHYGLSAQDLRGRSRAKAVVLPRQVAMYLIREITKASLPATGAELGGRDHTTVKHGCDKVRLLLEEDDALRLQASSIRERLYSLSSASD